MDKNPEGDVYAPDTPVSMNFWGFTPWIFTKLEEYFNAFLRALSTGELKKECLLPSMVGELIEKGQLDVYKRQKKHRISLSMKQVPEE